MSSAILCYHSFDETGGLFATPPRTFRWQLAALLDAGLRVVPLSDVVHVPGSVAITFDDGHRNFLDHALPVLVERKIPATLFVVSGYCGRAAFLSWSELREVAAAGVEVGAHTVLHRSLPALSEPEVLREMRDCCAAIEDHIGQPVLSFAYPYGHSSPPVREIAAREFQRACGSALALIDAHSNPFNLPRIFEFYLRHRFALRNLTGPSGRAYIAARRWLAALRGTSPG